MAHTPGPWKQHEDAPLYIMAKIGGKAGCIASVNHVEKGRGVIVEDETKANARLIASAPDLLAALTAAIQEVRFLASARLHEDNTSGMQWLLGKISNWEADIERAS